MTKQETLEVRKKHRPLKVKLLDDTVKTVLIDDSLPVSFSSFFNHPLFLAPLSMLYPKVLQIKLETVF